MRVGFEPRHSHSAVVFGDCILIFGGVKQKSPGESREDEKDREKDSVKDWGKQSSASENDMVEKLQYCERRIGLEEIVVLCPGNESPVESRQRPDPSAADSKDFPVPVGSWLTRMALTISF